MSHNAISFTHYCPTSISRRAITGSFFLSLSQFYRMLLAFGVYNRNWLDFFHRVTEPALKRRGPTALALYGQQMLYFLRCVRVGGWV